MSNNVTCISDVYPETGLPLRQVSTAFHCQAQRQGKAEIRCHSLARQNWGRELSTRKAKQGKFEAPDYCLNMSRHWHVAPTEYFDVKREPAGGWADCPDPSPFAFIPT